MCRRGTQIAPVQTTHLSRYKDIGTLLVKHRRLLSPSDREASIEDAQALADQLESMGPTFIKLGQLLSTRADLMPPEYIEALSRLQEKVEPFSFEDVQATFRREFGARISKAFADFDERPIASASLGQVHRARLRDGRLVAVKVRRPGIRDRVIDDMDVVEQLAAFADSHTETGRRLGFTEMADEFHRSLLAELDYRQEAANLAVFRANLADHEDLIVPAPIQDYTATTVLTMDFVSGSTLGSVSPVRLVEVDGPRLARTLFAAYMDQILLHGLFHADPHPGNVVITEDDRLALIDLGMTARVEPVTQDELIKLLLAVGDGRGHDAATVAIRLGRPLDDFDPDSFERGAVALINRNQGSTIGDVQAGAVVAELTKLAGQSGLRLPSELTMLGKALLNLDEVARRLDPHFDPSRAIQDLSNDLMRKKVLQSANSNAALSLAMEAKQFAEHLPTRLNDVLDAVAQGRLTLNVQGIDEQNLMRSAQKLANRVTAGIVVAALVIGAALIMRIQTSATLFGYPAFAIILFVMAAAAGIWLFVSIQLSDVPQRRRRGRPPRPLR